MPSKGIIWMKMPSTPAMSAARVAIPRSKVLADEACLG